MTRTVKKIVRWTLYVLLIPAVIPVLLFVLLLHFLEWAFTDQETGKQLWGDE